MNSSISQSAIRVARWTSGFVIAGRSIFERDGNALWPPSCYGPKFLTVDIWGSKTHPENPILLRGMSVGQMRDTPQISTGNSECASNCRRKLSKIIPSFFFGNEFGPITRWGPQCVPVSFEIRLYSASTGDCLRHFGCCRRNRLQLRQIPNGAGTIDPKPV